MSSSFHVPVSVLDEFTSLTPSREQRLSSQNPNVEFAYEVLSDLRDRIGHTDLYRTITSEYVLNGVISGTFDDVIRMIDVLIRPYAEELSEARNDAVRKVIKGMILRSKAREYEGSLFASRSSLSSDSRLVSQARIELRVVAAIWSVDRPGHEITQVVSRTNSPPTLQLTYGTSLTSLIAKSPERCDEIIRIIRSENEIDGDRIAAMLDSPDTPLRSGAL